MQERFFYLTKQRSFTEIFPKKISMIITITANPSIDKLTSIETIISEAKLRTTGVTTNAGGGGINVSKALNKINTPNTAFVVSGGDTGAELQEILSQKNINFKNIDTGVDTREVWIVDENSTGKQFRFTHPGMPINANVTEQIYEQLASFDCAYMVCSGSLPSGFDTNFYKNLAVYCHSKGIKCIVDTSGEPLKKLKGSQAFLIKPNQKELSELLGKESLTTNEIPEACRQLIQEQYAQTVVVSLGGDGAWLVTSQDQYYVPSPKVEVRSTVGAGDSMIAGLVNALAQGKALDEVLKWGVSCGSATTMQRGSNLFDYQDVLTLFEQI
jgi:6-phosphofructokinase 2